MKRNKSKCPSCGRSAIECWILPCLDLEIALADGEKAVNTWCKKAKAPFAVEAK